MTNRILLCVAAIAALFFVEGCASTRAQRVLLKTTEQVGAAANDARDALELYLIDRAMEDIGPMETASIEDRRLAVEMWVKAQPSYINMRSKYEAFREAYTVWVKANAAAVSGDTIRQVDLALVIDAARDLFKFVGSYVPAISKWEVVIDELETQ